MCGIIGIVGRDQAALEEMNVLQAHRGPNDSGQTFDPANQVGLAMRRLSILDLEGGHQPMPSADGSLEIVFNGEIYNSPEIRAELEKKGFPFKTRNSDTESLLNLYTDRSEEMLGRLNGMFAFVIYDRRRKILFGARDRFGIKPLYFVHRPGLFSFASELKSLLMLPAIRREINPQSLYHYLTLGYVPGEDSIISSIKKLRPGYAFHYDIQKGEFRPWKYWNLGFPEDGPTDLEECRRTVRKELEEAVRRWSLSDVPVACSLSGGLDSSSITALLARQSSHPVRTYSLGFDEEEARHLDELSLARLVARKYQTDHHELVLRPNDVLNDLVEMVWHLDEPYGGGLPSWYVFKFMAKDVKVGFTGTGGDELFGDYGKFIPLEGNPLKRWLGLNGSLDDRGFEEKYTDIFYYMPDKIKHSSALLEKQNPLQNTSAMLKAVAMERQAHGLRNALTYVDFQTQLPEEFLLMTDRFSMAHSLEARVPFLDHLFVERVLRIPSQIRTKRGDLKYLLRESVRDLLPFELLKAGKKGFVLPTSLWLRRELNGLAARLLSPDRLEKQGLFKSSFYKTLLEEHWSGKRDHHKQLWFALMFQLWHSVFIDGKADSKPAWTWRDLN